MAGLHRDWHGHLREPAPDCPWCVTPTAEVVAGIEAMEASSSADDEEGER